MMCITHAQVQCVFFQAVHAEMQDALNERDELKLRVHSYISEVARIESLMAAKVRDGVHKTLTRHLN